jgi:ectoine utilization protein EutD
MLPFEKTEYLARIDKTKRRMAEQGLDLLVAADTSNMNYLTGYDGWSFYTPQAVVIGLELDEPLCIVRGIDRGGALVTTFLDEANIVGYPDNYVQSAERHPMDFMADELKRRGLDGGVIGVEMDAYYYTAACHEALVGGLPNARFENANLLVNWVRIIKSEQEIAYMTDAARLVEKVMQAGIDAIEPGVRQCDAAAIIHHAHYTGTPEFGGEYTGLVTMLPTGVGTSTPHLTWNSKPFVRGEATILELAGCRNRYHCPMARTLHLGPPPQKLADTAEVVIEGVNTALDAVKPGMTSEEVVAVWNGVINKHGIVKESRTGYSTGLSYPPDWGEHTLSLRAGDKTVLEPNMTIHFMPGIWMDDWGIEISECFRVTETGAETFSDFPRKLFVKD